MLSPALLEEILLDVGHLFRYWNENWGKGKDICIFRFNLLLDHRHSNGLCQFYIHMTTGFIISVYSIFPSLPQDTVCLNRKEKMSFFSEGLLIFLRYYLYYNWWRVDSVFGQSTRHQRWIVPVPQRSRQSCWAGLFLPARVASWPFCDKVKVIC